MRAYQFLGVDMIARAAYATDWLSALEYAPGPVAAIVDVDSSGESTCKLLAAHDVTRELCVFICDCAERALTREPDRRSWEVVAVARRYAGGQATGEELDAVGIASWAAWAARDAARDAAGDAWAAGDTAGDAAWNGTRAAAGVAERKWQSQHLAELLDAVVVLPYDPPEAAEERR